MNHRFLMTDDMDTTRTNMYTMVCPQCQTQFAVPADSITEEQLENGFITCPKCGEKMDFNPDKARLRKIVREVVKEWSDKHKKGENKR